MIWPGRLTAAKTKTGLVEIADYFFATQTDLDGRPMRGLFFFPLHQG